MFTTTSYRMQNQLSRIFQLILFQLRTISHRTQTRLRRHQLTYPPFLAILSIRMSLVHGIQYLLLNVKLHCLMLSRYPTRIRVGIGLVLVSFTWNNMKTSAWSATRWSPREQTLKYPSDVWLLSQRLLAPRMSLFNFGLSLALLAMDMTITTHFPVSRRFPLYQVYLKVVIFGFTTPLYRLNKSTHNSKLDSQCAPISQ